MAALVVGGAVLALSEQPASADGSIVLYRSEAVCETLVDYGVGLQGDGAGTINVEAGPGTLKAAFLEWVGYDDTSPNVIAPGGDRADSELTINGVTVTGYSIRVDPPDSDGDCWVRLIPQPRGTEYEFVNRIVGGVIPGKLISINSGTLICIRAASSN